MIRTGIDGKRSRRRTRRDGTAGDGRSTESAGRRVAVDGPNVMRAAEGLTHETERSQWGTAVRRPRTASGAPPDRCRSTSGARPVDRAQVPRGEARGARSGQMKNEPEGSHPRHALAGHGPHHPRPGGGERSGPPRRTPSLRHHEKRPGPRFRGPGRHHPVGDTGFEPVTSSV